VCALTGRSGLYHTRSLPSEFSRSLAHLHRRGRTWQWSRRGRSRAGQLSHCLRTPYRYPSLHGANRYRSHPVYTPHRSTCCCKKCTQKVPTEGSSNKLPGSPNHTHPPTEIFIQCMQMQHKCMSHPPARALRADGRVRTGRYLSGLCLCKGEAKIGPASLVRPY
jgi:hypothetical protein